MAETMTRPALSPRLQQLIESHKAEVARLREEFGDPAEALSRFVREHYSMESLLPDERFGHDAVGDPWEYEDDDAR